MKFKIFSPNFSIFVLIWLLMHGLGNNLNWWLLNVLSACIRCSFCGWDLYKTLFDQLVYFLVYLLPGSSNYNFLRIICLGNIHILRNHEGRGWGWAKSLCMIIWGWVGVLNPSENDYVICGRSLISIKMSDPLHHQYYVLAI